MSSEGCETDVREIPNHSEQMAERSDDDLSTLYDIAYQVSLTVIITNKDDEENAASNGSYE